MKAKTIRDRFENIVINLVQLLALTYSLIAMIGIVVYAVSSVVSPPSRLNSVPSPAATPSEEALQPTLEPTEVALLTNASLSERRVNDIDTRLARLEGALRTDPNSIVELAFVQRDIQEMRTEVDKTNGRIDQVYQLMFIIIGFTLTNALAMAGLSFIATRRIKQESEDKATN